MNTIKFQQQSTPVKIPRRFYDAGLDDKTNKSLKEVASSYIEYFSEFYKNGVAPVFLGKSGKGKTYVAAAIVNELSGNQPTGYNVPVYWMDTVRDLNRLMDYRDYKKQEYFDLRQQISSTPLVVVDDFGHVHDFPRIQELFYDIVNDRYANKMPTIFTADFTGKDVWKEISNTFSPAVARRIYTMGKGLTVICE